MEYRPLRMAPGDTDVVVKSLVRQPGRPQPIAVDYAMEKLPSGWKVYDVKIEGVSLVENYRSTFAGEIQRHGVDGLIRTLERQEQGACRAAKRAIDDYVQGRPLQGGGADYDAQCDRRSPRKARGSLRWPTWWSIFQRVTEVDSSAVSLLLEWRARGTDRRPSHRVHERPGQHHDPR